MRNVFRSYFFLLIITLAVRFLDVAKNLIVASKIGVSGYADIYNSLQALPDNFVILLGIDTIKGVANSEYSALFSTGKFGDLKKSMNILLKYLTVFTLILTIIIVLLRSEIIKIALPGLSDSIYSRALQISVFIFPAFFVRSLSSLLMPYYNSKRKFYFPVLTQSLIAACIIISVFLPFTNDSIILNLSIAFLAGNILYLIVLLIPALSEVGIGRVFEFKMDAVTKIILVGCSAIIINSLMNQVYQSSRNFFVSYFPEGSISALTYGTTIPTFVGTLTFTIVFGVLLSHLSSLISNEKIAEAKKLFFDTLNILYFIYIPIVITFLLMSKNILTLVFLRGNFSSEGINACQLPFCWETLTLLPFLMYSIPTSLLLARKNYKYLTIAGTVAFLAGIILNMTFSRLIGFYGVSVGAFSFSCIYGYLLFIEVRRVFGPIRRDLIVIVKLLLCGVATISIFYFPAYFFNIDINTKGLLQNFFLIASIWFAVLVVFAVLSYLLEPKFVKYSLNSVMDKLSGSRLLGQFMKRRK